MTPKDSLTVAVIVAPLAVFPIVALSAATLGSPESSGVVARVEWALFVGTVAVVIAYAFTIVYGIPIFLLLRRLNFVRFWPIFLAGLAGPTVVSFPTYKLADSILFVLCGGLVAAIAWLIACWWPTRSNPAVERDGRQQAGARPSPPR